MILSPFVIKWLEMRVDVADHVKNHVSRKQAAVVEWKCN